VDDETVLGWFVAVAWLGLLVYLPIRAIRDAGSIAAWIRECWQDPLGSLCSVLMALGMGDFLLWLVTDGAVPVKFALLGAAGFAGHFVQHASRKSKGPPR